jgi:hypothetical protein
VKLGLDLVDVSGSVNAGPGVNPDAQLNSESGEPVTDYDFIRVPKTASVKMKSRGVCGMSSFSPFSPFPVPVSACNVSPGPCSSRVAISGHYKCAGIHQVPLAFCMLSRLDRGATVRHMALTRSD